jgi:hypothetical protein
MICRGSRRKTSWKWCWWRRKCRLDKKVQGEKKLMTSPSILCPSISPIVFQRSMAGLLSCRQAKCWGAPLVTRPPNWHPCTTTLACVVWSVAKTLSWWKSLRKRDKSRRKIKIGGWKTRRRNCWILSRRRKGLWSIIILLEAKNPTRTLVV